MALTPANTIPNSQYYYDTDSFAMKLKSDGSYAWARGMNTQIDHNAAQNTQIAVGSNGLVYLAGTYSPNLPDSTSNNPGTNLFVAQLSNSAGSFAPSAGTIMGYRTGGGTGSTVVNSTVLNNNDVAEGLALNPASNKVYVIGASPLGKTPSATGSNAPTFGNTTLTGSDAWIVTLNASTAYHKVTDDFDGDGKTDIVVYRPDTSTFVVNLSSGGTITQQWGWADHDTAGPGRLRRRRPKRYRRLSSGDLDLLRPRLVRHRHHPAIRLPGRGREPADYGGL